MLAPFATSALPHFASDFAGCRQLLLASLKQQPALGWHRFHPCDAAGPHDEPLGTDLLWLGSIDARRVLVLISGTHGVEGMAGSAIQRDFLSQALAAQWQPPADCAVLLIHALNPWGMAWLRRCDQHGIDLNRNFIDFNQPLPDNTGYLELRDAIFTDAPASRQLAFEQYRQQHGQAALEIAISGGQYCDPHGPFYGGNTPSIARQLIEALIRELALEQRQLAVIDLHTGLGPYGYGEIICDHMPNSVGTTTARQWYGDAVTLPLAGTSSSVPKAGLLDYVWHRIMAEHSCFVTLEFGTYSTDALFDTLLADHALHASGADYQSPAAHAMRKRMCAHFFPTARQWQELLIWRGRQTIEMALSGLQG